MKRIYLIDGNALIYRMFFALPEFSTKDGKQVNAIFGVAKFFMQDLYRENPDYVVFVRDAKGENFRHQIYSEYKATRDRMPDNLRTQVDDINDMVSLFHMDVVEIPMVEADDVIATLAKKLSQDKSNEIYILSGDKDLYSLVRENVKVYDTIKKAIYNEEKTKEKFGVEPRKIIDYLAIIGDKSDNIPGIDGIGPKKAIPLINEIGTLEEIYEYIEKGLKSNNDEINKILSGKTLEKIKDAKEIAFLSKKLATIKKDVDLGKFNLNEYRFIKESLLNDKTIELFKKYEFNSLLPNQEKAKQKKWSDLGIKVQIIGDDEGITNLENKLSNYTEIVLDTETTSLDIMKAKLVGISLLLDKENLFYINLGHNGPKTSNTKIKDFLTNLLNSNIKIIGHNLKYDLEIIEIFIKNNEDLSTNGQEKNNNTFGQMTLGL
ncbi:MAG: 5'-3' exonuclease H3TH domain-containing protein [Candidatus Gracilibacteria bacterium]|nr:5'-3' exonuclease H3TH domain-containing protein [Candidatus Gracilibacteria bacterium]